MVLHWFDDDSELELDALEIAVASPMSLPPAEDPTLRITCTQVLLRDPEARPLFVTETVAEVGAAMRAAEAEVRLLAGTFTEETA